MNDDQYGEDDFENMEDVDLKKDDENDDDANNDERSSTKSEPQGSRPPSVHDSGPAVSDKVEPPGDDAKGRSASSIIRAVNQGHVVISEKAGTSENAGISENAANPENAGNTSNSDDDQKSAGHFDVNLMVNAYGQEYHGQCSFQDFESYQGPSNLGIHRKSDGNDPNHSMEREDGRNKEEEEEEDTLKKTK